MPCIFCIAAIAVAATTIVPALLDRMEEKLKTRMPDLQRTAESSAVRQWDGTIPFESPMRGSTLAPVTVTIYRNSQRARIQVMTHDLTPVEAQIVEDEVALLLEATVVSRHDAHASAILERPRIREESRIRETERPESEPPQTV